MSQENVGTWIVFFFPNLVKCNKIKPYLGPNELFSSSRVSWLYMTLVSEFNFL